MAKFASNLSLLRQLSDFHCMSTSIPPQVIAWLNKVFSGTVEDLKSPSSSGKPFLQTHSREQRIAKASKSGAGFQYKLLLCYSPLKNKFFS